MNRETVILNKKCSVKLTPYIITEEKRFSFLLCPGGGYNNCDPKESEPVAKVLNEMGYNAYILQYSVGKHKGWPEPLEDFDMAMEYLCQQENEWAVDTEHIVACGFSAGGHVVSAAASIAKRKPFAAVLCYALVAEETLQFCLPEAPDTSTLVNKDTVPCFIASSRNDWIVPIFNTNRFMEACDRHYVDYEAHIYGYSCHGFSVGEAAGTVGPLFSPRVSKWVQDMLGWLTELSNGTYRSIKESAAYQDAHVMGYSIDHSCEKLFSNKKIARMMALKFPMQWIIYEGAKSQVGEFVKQVSLRQILELLGTKEEVLKKIDTELKGEAYADI
ncbi:MAG: alpha/beta hydrolase [Agathobacter sp.]|nr:alpha/beta hydrolase [Agathobacter sp.]